MAQMTEILEELSRLTGRHPEAMNHVMRTLRTSGHVETGRRGVTSNVSAKSATSLLIACLSGVQPADTPRAVEVFTGLRPLRKGGFGQGIAALELIAKADTFGQALQELLWLGPHLKREAMTLLALIFDKVPADQLLDLRFFEIELLLQRQPAPYAKLSLEAVNENGVYTHCFSQEWICDSSKLMSGFYAPEMKAQTDLKTQTSISHRSIFRIGDLLAADSTEEQSHDEVARTEGKAVEEDRRHAAAAAHGRERKPGSQHHRGVNIRLPQR
ncbi:hypothetical protein FHR70_001663 [Microvirga lupini]|uniref:Uncharacterized protein n=1 Tax=Microvirga lupini TaxID=420324 RepID=A0A7W4VK13_9HYPH|nr:hypothetical protein [Microvirga lupini]MBB3018609.1 hypothetical protein [Microvirga lupini]